MEDYSARLRNGLAEWLTFTEPMLADVGIYTWTGDDTQQFWEFLRRGIIKRQQEALQTTLAMVDQGHGHFAVTFLRPAYEELIWIEYLGQHISLAPELSLLLGRYEVGTSINAQNEQFGRTGMAAVGFTQRQVKQFAAMTRRSEARIKDIGRTLGWPKGRQTALPSMWFLSRKVGRERDYKFLYHATSRFVHFSAHEVYRRVWGSKGDVNIASGHFRRYWQDFAIYWGLRTFIQLVARCGEVASDIEISEEKHETINQMLRDLHVVPIITRGELQPWHSIAG